MALTDIVRTLASKLTALKAAWLGKHPTRQPRGEELPLRAELFSATQMEQHGRVLANAHQLSAQRSGNHLLERLADNESALARTCGLLLEALREGRQITPAADWMLVNHYLLDVQIRTTRQHLPNNYRRELPCPETRPIKAK